MRTKSNTPLSFWLDRQLLPYEREIVDLIIEELALCGEEDCIFSRTRLLRAQLTPETHLAMLNVLYPGSPVPAQALGVGVALECP